uniref:GST N-terminal domain-containing protein n=1 Tax=Moniliophthora roreri TaxID=221103 RepID=A0A0W0FQ43_MONRR
MSTYASYNHRMITLYDIGPVVVDGKETGLSPMVRRVMYILNYKGIPYNVKFLCYEDIQPTAKSLGAGPTGVRADGKTPRYTVPFITDSATSPPTAISDSINVAKYLENTYPNTPRIHPQDTEAFADAISKNFVPLSLIIGIHSRKITPPVLIEGQRKAYGDGFVSTVLSAEQEAETWQQVKSAFDDLYRDVGVQSEELSYADYALAGLFCMTTVFLDLVSVIILRCSVAKFHTARNSAARLEKAVLPPSPLVKRDLTAQCLNVFLAKDCWCAAIVFHFSSDKLISETQCQKMYSLGL